MISLLRFLLTCAGLLGRLLPRSPRTSRRMLVLAPGSLRAARAKGVEHQLADFSCGAYFDRVVFYHFNVTDPCSDFVSERVRVIESAPLQLLGPLNFFRYLWISIGLVHDYRITLIRSTDPYFRGILGALLSRLCHLPFCVSIHADYDKRYLLDGARGAPEVVGSRTRAKELERLVLAEAALVLPIRESLSPADLQTGNRAAIHVIPHGLDLDRYISGWPEEPIIAELFGIPPGRRIISFVGRISQENYAHDLIRAAIKLREIGRNNILFVFAGDGPERESVASELTRLGLDDMVWMLGFQSAETVCALRRQSYINLVLMGGFSLIEACAAGRPVISYDVEWHHELIHDGETGFLVEEGNVDRVVAHIVDLCEQPALAQRVGENARHLAHERHSLNAASAIKIAAYERLYRGSRETSPESPDENPAS